MTQIVTQTTCKLTLIKLFRKMQFINVLRPLICCRSFIWYLFNCSFVSKPAPCCKCQLFHYGIVTHKTYIHFHKNDHINKTFLIYTSLNENIGKLSWCDYAKSLAHDQLTSSEYGTLICYKWIQKLSGETYRNLRCGFYYYRKQNCIIPKHNIVKVSKKRRRWGDMLEMWDALACRALVFFLLSC